MKHGELRLGASTTICAEAPLCPAKKNVKTSASSAAPENISGNNAYRTARLTGCMLVGGSNCAVDYTYRTALLKGS